MLQLPFYVLIHICSVGVERSLRNYPIKFLTEVKKKFLCKFFSWIYGTGYVFFSTFDSNRMIQRDPMCSGTYWTSRKEGIFPWLKMSSCFPQLFSQLSVVSCQWHVIFRLREERDNINTKWHWKFIPAIHCFCIAMNSISLLKRNFLANCPTSRPKIDSNENFAFFLRTCF